MTHRACRCPTRIGIVWVMNPSKRREEQNEWAAAPWQGTAPQVTEAGCERRDRADRRKRVLWSLVYGSFHPRRRRPPRRLDDSRFHSLDWHAAHLLAVSIGILLLSVADAFMTVTLLAGGAVEVNPIMAAIVYHNAALFAAVKMAMTGIGVMLMVMLARYRLMRVRVDVVMYALLIGYLVLLTYEFGMLPALIFPFDL